MRLQTLGIVACAVAVVIDLRGDAADAPSPPSLIPVTVTVVARPGIVPGGEAIPLEFTVRNGLPGEIAYSTYSVTPIEWHGETVNISLVDIYRDGVKRGLLQARPKIEIPTVISGMSRHRILQGESLTIRTDARKWTIDGGWKPGKYEVTARVDRLSVDHDRCQLSVSCEPFEFEIK